MRERVLVILRGAARRLLLRRVLESCAVTAAAGGLCAAVVALGWWLSPVSGPAGAVVCAVASLCGIWLWLRAPLHQAMRLDAGQAALAGGLMVVGGAVGGAGALLGWAAVAPAWGASAALVLGGVAIGAIPALARGVSAMQAAVYLDIHGGFDERLATAAEAADEQAQGTFADGLYAQALDVLADPNSRKVPAWKRTRATLGALALAAALCGLTGSLPALKTVGRAGVTDLADLPEALKEMGPGQLRVIEVAMETLADEPGVSADVAKALRKSAGAVRGKDGKRLKDALARALARADAATRKRIEDVILAAAQSTSGAGAGGTGGGSAPAPSSTRPSTGAGSDVARVGGSGVVVYHPEYAKQMRKGGHAAAGDEGRVSMDHMWRRYRDNAVDALDNGQVPAEYRPIIRKFFDTEPR